MCKTARIVVFDELQTNEIFFGKLNSYAWWDVVRLNGILEEFNNNKQDTPTILQIDLDVIVEKDLTPLTELPYDVIFSKEIGGDKSYPPECSSVLGFGLCTGFFIMKPTGVDFMSNILAQMIKKQYGTHSDQVTIMKHIVNTNHTINFERCVIAQHEYENAIISIDGIKICVLDFELIVRDPVKTSNQFANHINMDNVGGPTNLIKYFYEKLENLPSTVRRGV